MHDGPRPASSPRDVNEPVLYGIELSGPAGEVTVLAPIALPSTRSSSRPPPAEARDAKKRT